MQIRRASAPPSNMYSSLARLLFPSRATSSVLKMISAPQEILLVLALISLCEAQISRQTLYSLQGYSDLQPCAQSCIMDPDSCRVGGIDQIAINIGCQYNWCASD